MAQEAQISCSLWPRNDNILTVRFLIVLIPALLVQDSDLKKADEIRATPAEVKYLKIPWVTDVFKGFETAKEEKRPVFLYTIVGNALDDC